MKIKNNCNLDEDNSEQIKEFRTLLQFTGENFFNLSNDFTINMRNPESLSEFILTYEPDPDKEIRFSPHYSSTRKVIISFYENGKYINFREDFISLFSWKDVDEVIDFFRKKKSPQERIKESRKTFNEKDVFNDKCLAVTMGFRDLIRNMDKLSNFLADNNDIRNYISKLEIDPNYVIKELNAKRDRTKDAKEGLDELLFGEDLKFLPQDFDPIKMN